MDIDPNLVRLSESRLATLGYTPRLIAGDGHTGAAEYGPYDRIIATCAVAEVPLSWIEQLAPGGAMLINLRGEFAGALCFLAKQGDDEVAGRVVRSGGNFMWMRKKL
jgi:protein-L-isoaspartate O-methyltransferase